MDSDTINGSYPSGMGPFTGRVPNVKKLEWLKQKAPQGQRFDDVKQPLSRLKHNTVCEEVQCLKNWRGHCNNNNNGAWDTCTQGFRFCVVKINRNLPSPDPIEPKNTTQAIAS
ncbi:hypothetical protein V6N13_133790 [Hibiscus sabdariffa]|uniref:Lipoyl synthase N-terminal domain-containing protein n=1 Tax=Hibiscus sabdariffa TaxID=183260 RepID=A0ABR2R0L9_9ROSI